MQEYPLAINQKGTVQDWEYLYYSLGSFWTDVFKDKETIKGYSKGMAEEMVQRYYDLVETINSYSVEDINIYHKQKWQPLYIYKSRFGAIPFVFEKDGAVFGPQPAEDPYYSGRTFNFGGKKTPAAEVFLYKTENSLKEFGAIVEQILNPKVLYTYSTDVILEDGVLFFNKNIFENSLIPRVTVVDEFGKKVTYTNDNGDILDEELIILWICNASIDTEYLYKSFGSIFGLKLQSGVAFKEILNQLVNLYIDGPTIKSMLAVCAAFLLTPVSLENDEVVEQYIVADDFKYIITDKRVYKFATKFNLAKDVVVGNTLKAGTSLTDALLYLDNPKVISGWWKGSNILDSKLALSQYLFNGPYMNQLIFSNSLELVTLNAQGDIVFPVEGSPKDVELFQKYINEPVNQQTIKDTFNLTNPGDIYPLIPVDFVMENFLKLNAAILSIKFDSTMGEELTILLPLLKNALPPYVYLITKLSLSLETENYDKLNNSSSITIGNNPPETVNSDGSNEDGLIEKIAPDNYKNVKNRLFELSRGVPIDIVSEYEYVYFNRYLSEYMTTYIDFTACDSMTRGELFPGAARPDITFTSTGMNHVENNGIEIYVATTPGIPNASPTAYYSFPTLQIYLPTDNNELPATWSYPAWANAILALNLSSLTNSWTFAGGNLEPPLIAPPYYPLASATKVTIRSSSFTLYHDLNEPITFYYTTGAGSTLGGISPSLGAIPINVGIGDTGGLIAEQTKTALRATGLFHGVKRYPNPSGAILEIIHKRNMYRPTISNVPGAVITDNLAVLPGVQVLDGYPLTAIPQGSTTMNYSNLLLLGFA